MAAEAKLTAMEAHTLVLLGRSKGWSHAVRNTDGRKFTLFTGSTGQTYWTTEVSCSCRGYQWRQSCAHVTAVQRDAERARAKAFRRPKAAYESLFVEDAF